MKVLRKFWPSSLYGQLLLVTALALLLAQAVNTAMLVAGARARAEVEASSMLVARMSSQIERQRQNDASDDRRRGRGDRSRRRNAPISVVTSNAPLVATGFHSNHELSENAAEYFSAVDPGVRSVGLAIGPIQGLPQELEMAVMQRSRNARLGTNVARRPREAVFMTLQLGRGQWISAAAYIRPFGGQPFLMLFMQTAILYLAVLIPLALIARRIAKPLRSLTDRVQQSGFTPDAPPLQPQGPSDVRELIESFNMAQSRHKALLTEKDVMLGAIGHDLKTPLASLRVRIESVDDDCEREKMSATIAEMTAILDDILMLARLGNSAEPASATDIRSLVETVISEFPENAAITSDLGNARNTALIRPILLKRAIRNLIDNALKYGDDAHVTVVSDVEGFSLLLDDNGPGISADKIPHMFEPFAREETSRSRQHGGTGLGLTIARAIVQAHGGTLQLENRLEGGLRVRLSIKGLYRLP
jgi:signal transduction histidine kinase